MMLNPKPLSDESDPDPMAYEKPQKSFNQIDKAGVLVEGDSSIENLVGAMNDIWNWRAAHSYPLNALHMTLRNRARRLDSSAITAQRLKRFDSILRKLHRRQSMQLSQMQDIGGCRAVMLNMPRLSILRAIYDSNPLRHELSRMRDYIADPKEDGYRSVHLMYRFRGRASSLPWDKLRIEIQLRTKLQHAWATAVETVDAFTGQELKFGGGNPQWARFFALIGSVHAIYEKSPTVSHTPDTHQNLLGEVKELEQELSAIRALNGFAKLTEHITGMRGEKREWYLIEMLPQQGRMTIRGFPLTKFDIAKAELAGAEQRFKDTQNQAVLVSVSSLNELRKAYPNYFGDTEHFTNVLKGFLHPGFRLKTKLRGLVR